MESLGLEFVPLRFAEAILQMPVFVVEHGLGIVLIHQIAALPRWGTGALPRIVRRPHCFQEGLLMVAAGSQNLSSGIVNPEFVQSPMFDFEEVATEQYLMTRPSLPSLFSAVLAIGFQPRVPTAGL